MWLTSKNGYEHLNVLVEGAPCFCSTPRDEIPTGTEVVFTNLNARPWGR